MISLITATYGRTEEVRTLLGSLARQSYKDFEFILVDQNPHFILREMVAEYASRLTIQYIRSEAKGLSLNRNIGLDYSRGEIVAFPDDDCFYEEDVLEKVIDVFQRQKDIVLVATAVKDAFDGRVWKVSERELISCNKTLRYCFSNNIFVRKTEARFDVRLGVGAYWGSGEESDYLWEILDEKDVGIFLRDTYINHPYIADVFVNIPKAYAYGLGFGALFKKEVVGRKHYAFLFRFIYYVLRSVGGCLLSRHTKYYYYTLRGRIMGFVTFPVSM